MATAEEPAAAPADALCIPEHVRQRGVAQGLKDFFAAVRPNAGQFTLNIFLTMLIGAIVSVSKMSQAFMTDPDKNGDGVIETGEFIVSGHLRSTQFLVAFGWSKAVANFVVGVTSDTFGRKPMMIVGWVIGLAMPIMVMCADNWDTVVASNVFMGLQQGICWSLCIFMMVDYAGAMNRGIAVGLNETTGYVMIAIFGEVCEALTKDSERNYREEPYYLILAFTIAGLLVSILFLKDSRPVVLSEQRKRLAERSAEWTDTCDVTWPGGRVRKINVMRMAFVEATFLNTSLMACCQAGLMINFMTAFAWGIGTKWLKSYGNDGVFDTFSKATVADILLAYSITKGVFQFISGFISDRIGRRATVCSGLVICSTAMACWAMVGSLATSQEAARDGFFFSAFWLGFGTALMYPTVIAAAAEHCDPTWRASGIGTYRFWRDSGYAIGGLVLGAIADSDRVVTAISVTAGLAFLSAVLFGIFYEEHPEGEIDMEEVTRGIEAKQDTIQDLVKPADNAQKAANGPDEP